MAHVAKYTKGAVGHMFKHCERARDEKGEYIKFWNENIDTSKSHLNYNLAPNRDINQGEFVKQRCSEVQCLNRKDVNVICSWVVTAPEGLPKGREREFFEQTYNFLENRYGAKNVVSSYVHMDEVTPHMHFAFVPVVYDQKKDVEKVSAKLKVCKSDLQTFHKDLEGTLERYFGQEVGILNQSTKECNKTIVELKKESAVELGKELDKHIEALKSDLKSVSAFDDVKLEKINLPLLKGKVAVSKEQYEQNISLGKLGMTTMRENQSLKAENKKLTQGYQEVINQEVKKVKNDYEKEIQGLKTENSRLKQGYEEQLHREVQSFKETYKGTLEDKDKDIEKLRAENQSLKTDNQYFHAENVKLSMKVTKLGKENKVLSNEIKIREKALDKTLTKFANEDNRKIFKGELEKNVNAIERQITQGLER